LCAITAVLVLVYPSALFHVVGTITPDNQVKLAQSLVAGALLLYAIDKRVRHAPSIEDVRTEDPRPPVMYLRAFNQGKNSSPTAREARGGSGWLDSLGHSVSGAWRVADYAAVSRVVRLSEYTWSGVWPSSA
jgi:hypothetical protein